MGTDSTPPPPPPGEIGLINMAFSRQDNENELIGEDQLASHLFHCTSVPRLLQDNHQSVRIN